MADILDLVDPAFKRDLSDASALRDAFDLCQLIEHVDFGLAHEKNRLVHSLAGKYAIQQNSSAMYDIYNQSMLFEAPHDFDFFMLALERNRPLKEQFWRPRRKKLMHICKALQDLHDDKLDELFLSAPPRVGKALADDTPILTRNGWKNHGDLVVGDEVIGPEGQFKKVIAVHPKCQLDVMVEFTNGEKIQCHENHEWKLFEHNTQKTLLLETKEYEKKPLESGEPNKRGHRYRYQLLRKSYLVGEEKELALDPYVLGVWLGDGSNKDPRIANPECDKAIIERIVSNGYPVRWSTKHKTTGVMYYDFDIRKQLQSFGMCHSRKRTEKHIPEEYLTASVKQRLNLLAGLLDTDGTYTRKEKRYHYATCCERLRDDFISLVSTFGWRTCVSAYEPTVSSSGIVGRSVCYQISFCPDCEIPCSLPRKQNHEFAKYRAVSLKSITRVEPKQGNCITVEGDGMYLAGRMLVPTHNTAIVQMFLLWMMGKDTEKSNLYCSFSGKPVDTFYNGLLEVLKDPDTYAYNDIFPGVTVASTNALDGIVDLNRKKKYPSFTGRPIGGSLNGSCDCNGLIIGDDLCEGIETASSSVRLSSLWAKVDNNLLTRAKEGCKKLWIGTRWSLLDPEGVRLDVLENEPEYHNVRWRVLNTPALDKDDESNFDYDYGVGFSTAYFKQRRASFERNSDIASWLAQYQGEPIERDGAVFDPSEMRFYNGVLPNEAPDRVFMVVDPSWGGGDHVAAVVVYQYGQDLFVPDVIFNNSDKTVTQPMIIGMVERFNISAMKIEGTKTTSSYGEDIDKALRAKNMRINIQVNTSHWTTQGKRDRIIAAAPDVRSKMIFLQEGMRSKEYSQFMQNMYSFTFVMKKNASDDAPDVCSMTIDFAFKGMAKAEVFARPW